MKKGYGNSQTKLKRLQSYWEGKLRRKWTKLLSKPGVQADSGAREATSGTTLRLFYQGTKTPRHWQPGMQMEGHPYQRRKLRRQRSSDACSSDSIAFSKQKRREKYHDNITRYLSSIGGHHFGTSFTILLSKLLDNWRKRWKPALRGWRDQTLFWSIQTGTILLAAPILIPWEIVSLCGFLLMFVWKALCGLRRRQTWVKARDGLRWLLDGDWVGMLIGACIAAGNGYGARRYNNR